MRRVLALAVIVALAIAPVSLTAASVPSITGAVAGVELCPQSICGAAIFAGNFAGMVNSRPVTGVFSTAVTHQDLPTTVGGKALITGGAWAIQVPGRLFAGAVAPGGTLTYNGDNTYTVQLTMVLTTGGTGTLSFTGILNHNMFPPTIGGTITQ
jgi:hypothetical protein